MPVFAPFFEAARAFTDENGDGVTFFVADVSVGNELAITAIPFFVGVLSLAAVGEAESMSMSIIKGRARTVSATKFKKQLNVADRTAQNFQDTAKALYYGTFLA